MNRMKHPNFQTSKTFKFILMFTFICSLKLSLNSRLWNSETFLALCNAENSARSCNLCFGIPLTLGYNLKLPRYLSQLGFYHSSYLKPEFTSKLPTCATRHIIICFIHFKSPEVKNNCLQQVDCNTVTPHNSTIHYRRNR